VAPSGKSTIAISRSSEGSSLSLWYRSLQRVHMFVGSLGLQLKWQIVDVVILGNISAKARTTVVLPEPFGPRIKTPPIFGLIALISIASRSLSRSTMAENGNSVRSCIGVWTPK